MITLKDAYLSAFDKALSWDSEIELQNCTDIGDRYVFSFGIAEESIIGMPLFTVDKVNGELGILGLPDEKNFELLENGKNVDITSCH